MGEQVMPRGDRLGPLEVRVPGHGEPSVAPGDGRQRLDRGRQLLGDRRSRSPAVESEVESDLVIARPSGVEPGGALGVQLGRPPLDRGVNVLVGVGEDEPATLDLPPDLDQGPLQAGELGLAEKARLDQAAGVGDAAGDVVGRQLEVDLQRAREALQLRQEGLAETPSPQLPLAQGVSLFTSPRRPARSRVWSWPWT